MMNMIEYASIYLKKKKPSAEYTRILYVSHAIYNNKYLYKLLSSYQNKDI